MHIIYVKKNKTKRWREPRSECAAEGTQAVHEEKVGKKVASVGSRTPHPSKEEEKGSKKENEKKGAGDREL